MNAVASRLIPLIGILTSCTSEPRTPAGDATPPQVSRTKVAATEEESADGVHVVLVKLAPTFGPSGATSAKVTVTNDSQKTFLVSTDGDLPAYRRQVLLESGWMEDSTAWNAEHREVRKFLPGQTLVIRLSQEDGGTRPIRIGIALVDPQDPRPVFVAWSNALAFGIEE
jgi:hypothetical protein